MTTTHQIAPDDIVRTREEVSAREPLVVVEPLLAVLDEHGIGEGYPNWASFNSLMARFLLDLLFTVIAVRVVYSRLYHQRDYIFTYLLLNVVTFFLAFLLSKSPIGLGSAFGLFAVFGILRYRTEGIQVRNLTYLFVVIGVALLNALANDQVSLVELVTVNVIIVGSVCLLEASSFSRREESRQVLYDRLDLLGAATQSQLIEDLLDVSRMSKGAASLTVMPMDLRSSVGSAVETLRPAAAAKEIAVEVGGADAALLVIGDEERLQQVLWNLLANALKYTPRGGSVKITSSSDGDRAVVTVSDNGEGIDPAFLPHVFEPFRQGASATMRTGLGLGLAIVRRLVDLHGGRITAESKGAGYGATFTLSLPLAHGTKGAA